MSKKLLYGERDEALQMSQRGCEVSVFGDIQNPSEHILEQPDLANPTSVRVLVYVISKHPCQPYLFCDFVCH